MKFLRMSGFFLADCSCSHKYNGQSNLHNVCTDTQAAFVKHLFSHTQPLSLSICMETIYLNDNYRSKNNLNRNLVELCSPRRNRYLFIYLWKGSKSAYNNVASDVIKRNPLIHVVQLLVSFKLHNPQNNTITFSYLTNRTHLLGRSRATINTIKY